MTLRLALLACVGMAGAARADEPLLALEFGGDRLVAGAADVESAEVTVDMTDRPALLITLVPAFDAAMEALTKAHVGETGKIRICGTIVSEPQLVSELSDARFLVSGISAEDVSRLAAIVQSGRCPEDATN